MDLTQVTQSVLEELNNDGTVRKIVRERLEKTITGVADDLMSSYSPFGKAIKLAVQEKLQVNLEKLDLEDYNAIICNIIRTTLTDQAYANAQTKITHAIESTVGLIEKKEWKLSEIINEYKLAKRFNEESDSGSVHLASEESEYGTTWINIQEKAPDSYLGRRPSSSAGIRIAIDTKSGRIWGFWNDGQKIDPLQSNNDSFMRFMFRLWANQVTIINDENDAELDYGYQD